MQINSKVTGALAWTGLVLVLAVPAAGMFFGSDQPKTTLTSDTEQVRTAAIKPVVTQAVSAPETPAVVEEFAKSGKKKPSYISDDLPVAIPAPVVKKPGTITVNPDGTVTRPGTIKPVTETATIQPLPRVVAPIPAPASQRPKPLPRTEVPLIIEESDVAALPLEPEPIISGEELEEWDTGSLADYLERKGLMSDAPAGPSEAEYDADGFFLEDGPNAENNSRVRVYRNGDLLF